MPGSLGEYTLHALGLESSNGNGSDIDLLPSDGRVGADNKDVLFTLNVTAATVPTTLDVILTALMESGSRIQVGTFTQVGATTPATEAIVVSNCPKNVRAEWTIVGTDYTLEVLAQRVKL